MSHEQRLQFLLGAVRQTPDMFLDELQEMLAVNCRFNVCQGTVWNVLRRAGFTLKKVSQTSLIDVKCLLSTDDMDCGRALSPEASRLYCKDKRISSRAVSFCRRKLG
jgi:hypothetical protein